MTSQMFMLAQTTEAVSNLQLSSSENFAPIDFIWQQISTLTWLQAVIAISFGAVYLLSGCKIFKILVVIAFSLIGMAAGVYAGKYFDNPNWQIWGAVIAAVVLGVLSIPLMRWAVSLLGAIAGGVLTAAAWYAFGLPDNYLIFAGALIGFIAGGMLSFIIFDAAVILFTSLGGGCLIIIGLLALLGLYKGSSQDIHDWVYNYKWFLPVAIVVPTIFGVLVQKHIMKVEKT